MVTCMEPMKAMGGKTQSWQTQGVQDEHQEIQSAISKVDKSEASSRELGTALVSSSRGPMLDCNRSGIPPPAGHQWSCVQSLPVLCADYVA